MIKIEDGSSVSITGFSIFRNINLSKTDGDGGVLDVFLLEYSSVIIKDTTFYSISAEGNGGAIYGSYNSKSVFNVSYSTFKSCKVTSDLDDFNARKGNGGAIYLYLFMLSEASSNLNFNYLTLGERVEKNKAYKGDSLFIYSLTFPNCLSVYYNFRFLLNSNIPSSGDVYAHCLLTEDYGSLSNILNKYNTSTAVANNHDVVTCYTNSKVSNKCKLPTVLKQCSKCLEDASIYVSENDVISDTYNFTDGCNFLLTKADDIEFTPVITMDGGAFKISSKFEIKNLIFSIFKSPSTTAVFVVSSYHLSLINVILGGIDENIRLNYRLIEFKSSCSYTLENVTIQYLTLASTSGLKGALYLDETKAAYNSELGRYEYGNVSDVTFISLDSDMNNRASYYYLLPNANDNLEDIRIEMSKFGTLTDKNQGMVNYGSDDIDLFEGKLAFIDDEDEKCNVEGVCNLKETFSESLNIKDKNVDIYVHSDDTVSDLYASAKHSSYSLSLSKEKNICRNLDVVLKNFSFSCSRVFSISNLRIKLKGIFSESVFIQEKEMITLSDVLVSMSSSSDGLEKTFLQVIKDGYLTLTNVRFSTLYARSHLYGLCFYLDTTEQVNTNYGVYSNVTFYHCRYYDDSAKKYKERYYYIKILSSDRTADLVEVLEGSILSFDMPDSSAYVCCKLGLTQTFEDLKGMNNILYISSSGSESNCSNRNTPCSIENLLDNRYNGKAKIFVLDTVILKNSFSLDLYASYSKWYFVKENSGAISFGSYRSGKTNSSNGIYIHGDVCIDQVDILIYHVLNSAIYQTKGTLTIRGKAPVGKNDPEYVYIKGEDYTVGFKKQIIKVIENGRISLSYVIMQNIAEDRIYSSGFYGFGICVITDSDTNVSIDNSKFIELKSYQCGGALYINVPPLSSVNITSSEFKLCSAYKPAVDSNVQYKGCGGAIYLNLNSVNTFINYIVLSSLSFGKDNSASGGIDERNVAMLGRDLYVFSNSFSFLTINYNFPLLRDVGLEIDAKGEDADHPDGEDLINLFQFAESFYIKNDGSGTNCADSNENACNLISKVFDLSLSSEMDYVIRIVDDYFLTEKVMLQNSKSFAFASLDRLSIAVITVSNSNPVGFTVFGPTIFQAMKFILPSQLSNSFITSSSSLTLNYIEFIQENEVIIPDSLIKTTSDLIINSLKVNNIKVNGKDGGAINAKVATDTSVTIKGDIVFTNCCAERGGAIYLNYTNNEYVNYLTFEDGSSVKFFGCSANTGKYIYIHMVAGNIGTSLKTALKDTLSFYLTIEGQGIGDIDGSEGTFDLYTSHVIQSPEGCFYIYSRNYECSLSTPCNLTRALDLINSTDNEIRLGETVTFTGTDSFNFNTLEEGYIIKSYRSSVINF